MSETIQLRRGTNAQRETVIFASGEPVWTTDTKALYIGDGTTTGGNAVGGGGGSLPLAATSAPEVLITDPSSHTVLALDANGAPLLQENISGNSNTIGFDGSGNLLLQNHGNAVSTANNTLDNGAGSMNVLGLTVNEITVALVGDSVSEFYNDAGYLNSGGTMNFDSGAIYSDGSGDITIGGSYTAGPLGSTSVMHLPQNLIYQNTAGGVLNGLAVVSNNADTDSAISLKADLYYQYGGQHIAEVIAVTSDQTAVMPICINAEGGPGAPVQIGLGTRNPIYAIDIYDLGATGTDIGDSTTGLWSISAAGVFTGNGSGLTNVPIANGKGLLLAQVGSLSSVAAYTPTTGVPTIVQVGGAITITSLTTDSIQMVVSYVDENSVSQTVNLGSPVSTVSYASVPLTTIMTDGVSPIIVSTVDTGLGTSTYDVAAYLIQL